MSNSMSESHDAQPAPPGFDPAPQRQRPPLTVPGPTGTVETDRIISVKREEHPTWKMLNQYRVGRTLGRGTHGIVKQGYDLYTGRDVAIKILKKTPRRKKLPRAENRDNKTSSTLSRIRHEVAVMKRCDHDHIVRLLEVIDDPRYGSIYLVMEHLEGGEIKWRGTDRPLLSLDQTRRIIRDVLLGLEYLHYMGIIHRDIKPSNMLWTHNRMRVKLTDFGVAHFSKPVRVDTGHLSNSPAAVFSDDEDHLFKTEGTPAFYAPEQAYNQNGLPVPEFPPGQRPPHIRNNSIFPMTKALDVWALGVTIYCLLFGKPPYWGENVHHMCKEIIESDYELPSLVAQERIPLEANHPEVKEALRLMNGMMTKPVWRRMTLTQAKESWWLTKDIDDPDNWRRKTDPKTSKPIIVEGNEPATALAAKSAITRFPDLMKIFKKKPFSAQSDAVSTTAADTGNPGSSAVSLERSTHRPLPSQSRSIFRPSTENPSSPVDNSSHAVLSSASSPTGGHHSDSYFPVTGVKARVTRIVKSYVDIAFRKNKKSNSSEAIMPIPAPMTAMTPAPPAGGILSSSCPNSDVGSTMRRGQPQYQDDHPVLISYSYSSSDDYDEESEDEFGGGYVRLVGFGGFESRREESNVSDPSSSVPRSIVDLTDIERSSKNIRGQRRTSLSDISDADAEPERIYDTRYPQHTHHGRRSIDDSKDGTVTEPPIAPKSIYIAGASSPPPPLPASAPTLVRSPAQRTFPVNGDDSEEEEDTPLRWVETTKAEHDYPSFESTTSTSISTSTKSISLCLYWDVSSIYRWLIEDRTCFHLLCTSVLFFSTVSTPCNFTHVYSFCTSCIDPFVLLSLYLISSLETPTCQAPKDFGEDMPSHRPTTLPSCYSSLSASIFSVQLHSHLT